MPTYFRSHVNSIEEISRGNSTSEALTTGSTFTGEWEDVQKFPGLTIALKASHDCKYYADFSTDKTNVDSTLTYFFRSGTIEAPKTLARGRQWFRLRIENTSGG
jgi:hypothetical protein